uniref:Sister-chromatid cohesion protein 3 n=1 Tax=Tanacetum cinerariifolium TaxID=118510 RepID=A0A699KJG8_TANCI|nr:sister-chromatid cohesion protein 3 [Tanacetum cinerariifolium]
MMLDENPSIKLTDDDATNLTRLFCASVKKAVEERIVLTIDHRKPNHTKAQKGELKDYAQNKLKEVEDELVVKVKSAIR